MSAYDRLMFMFALLSVLLFFGFFVIYVLHLMNNALKDFRATREDEERENNNVHD